MFVKRINNKGYTDVKGVKRFTATFLIITGLVLLLAEGAYAYLLHTRFELFGHPCDIYMENISFEGSEITDFATLENGLRKFPHLKTVDTGSFMMYAEDIPELQRTFPNVTFRYDTWVNIEGADYPIDATEVNLTDHGYTDLEHSLPSLRSCPAFRPYFSVRTISQPPISSLLWTDSPEWISRLSRYITSAE